MAIHKECRNCNRVMAIQADHLCGGCNNSVKGKTKGTPEYETALAAAKERFTNPATKPLRREKKLTASAKPIPANSEKQQKNIPPQIMSKNRKTDTGIIATLEDRRHELMEEVIR